MTLHAEEEMDNDALTVFDVEHCILSGEIVKGQRDRVMPEWKYFIRGKSIGGNELEVIVRLTPTGKLVIITVYLL